MGDYRQRLEMEKNHTLPLSQFLKRKAGAPNAVENKETCWLVLSCSFFSYFILEWVVLEDLSRPTSHVVLHIPKEKPQEVITVGQAYFWKISGKLKVSEAHNRNTSNLHRPNELNNELKFFTNGQNIFFLNQPQFFLNLL